jgi:dolichol-phosphate mannosyltransferase
MLSLILPTFNEAENLPELLPAIEEAMQDQNFEILIVDDDSPDETWRLAEELAKSRPHLRVIRRIGRRGLSSAVIEGFLAAKGEVLAVMDADGQHDAALLSRLHAAVIAPSIGADIAIGSRYMEGGSVGVWDERRHLLSRAATRISQRLCRVVVHDPMSGFFAIRRSVFMEVLPRLNPMGFKILLDLLVHVPRETRAVELPFRFGTRLHGESKLSARVQIEFLEYLWDVTVGRAVPLTFVKFCLVGATGVVVHLLTYTLASWLLREGGRLAAFEFSLAVLIAIEVAIVWNFTLNNAWTFARARLRGPALLLGFLKFNAACALGAVANYAVAEFLYERGGAELACVLAGALASVAWNYGVNRLITWKGA